MGIRFRRSIRIGKFLRINFSKSGIGASVGVAGFRVGTGPHGQRMTVSLPGTGLSYQKTWGRSNQSGMRWSSMLPETMPTPSFLAPRHEKAFAAGLKAAHDEQTETATQHLLEAAPHDPGAALLAAFNLADSDSNDEIDRAIGLLETLLQSTTSFPTPLMQKYMPSDYLIPLDVTPHVTITIAPNAVGATMLLIELYQRRERFGEAIGLAEELSDEVDSPAVILSLCDLYAQQGIWDGITTRAQGIESNDDITLAIVLLYAQAMQQKGLYDAAIKIYTAAMRRKKDRTPELLFEARYQRALAYEHTGQASRARKEFELLYADAPEFRDVGVRLGQA